jgi:hypothetical protein
MADITVVNGVYKPTNKTGGHHPAGLVELRISGIKSLLPPWLQGPSQLPILQVAVDAAYGGSLQFLWGKRMIR